jgi:hypothetical protein
MFRLSFLWANPRFQVKLMPDEFNDVPREVQAGGNVLETILDLLETRNLDLAG